MDNDRILININRFGPFINEEDNKLFVLNKKRHEIDNNIMFMIIEPLENFLEKKYEEITRDEINRYRSITNDKTHILFTPAQSYEKIMNRIINPLILAKKYFSLGNYLGSILMSGLSAEMLIHILWSTKKFTLMGNKLDNNDEKTLFGYSNQERKIDILTLLGIISIDQGKLFHQVREIRNKYIHSWDINFSQDKGNAKKVVLNVLTLFKQISGMGLIIDKNSNQKIGINPMFQEFLNSQIKINKSNKI